MKTDISPAQFCRAHGACSDGAAFALRHTTMAEVWDNCLRADWLLWILRRIEALPDDHTLRLFACHCVRETPLGDGRKVWDLLTDERSRKAIEVAELYAQGKASKEELDAAAAYAASAAAYAASAASAAAYAAYAAPAAAPAAAYAAPAAAYAASAAASAAAYAYAYAYAYAAAYAAYVYAAAPAAAQKFQADALRAIVPNPFL